jgi:ribosome-binding protein aMBF1 (putative translation factor)
MPKSLSSSYPPASSASSTSGVRAKSLGLHESKIQRPAEASTAPVHNSAARKHARRETQYDSANFEAARRLRGERQLSGLTIEELAAACGENKMTIWRRENNRVFLGPKRQEVINERAARVKGNK